jgi:CRP-like cAMP-binding protein
MKNEIVQYLSKYIELTEELENALSDNLLIREYPKGTVLLREGELCNECFLILKGLIRSYYLKEEGDEITTDFHMEEQVASPSCFGSSTPSDLFLECLEDTVAFVGTPQMESDMFLKFPQLETMSRVMGEKIMANYKDSYDTFKMSSPEQRYLNLVETNYDLIQRAPQYQIASFLGMKPESLSRIRKRLSKSK